MKNSTKYFVPLQGQFLTRERSRMYMMAHNNTGSPASSPRSAGPQSPSGAEVRTQSQEKTLAE